MEFVYFFSVLIILYLVVVTVRVRNSAKVILSRWVPMSNKVPSIFSMEVSPYLRCFIFTPETKAVYVKLGLDVDSLYVYKMGCISVFFDWATIECDLIRVGGKQYTSVTDKVSGVVLFQTTFKLMEAIKSESIGLKKY